MGQQYDLSGLVNPSLQQLNLSPTGQTTNPLEAGYYANIPNQGSPTFTPNGNAISLPAGYYGGGTVDAVAVKLTTGAPTVSTSEGTFYLINGTSQSAYYVTVPVPSGATEILAVFIVGTGAYYADSGWAAPRGAADGQNGASLAWWAESGTSFESGGSLSLNTTAIVVPIANATATYAYTVYYV